MRKWKRLAGKRGRRQRDERSESPFKDSAESNTRLSGREAVVRTRWMMEEEIAGRGPVRHLTVCGKSRKTGADSKPWAGHKKKEHVKQKKS